MTSAYDVVIIGGGAAGLCAAVQLAQNDPALSVAVAEQLPRVGKKLIVTGNGRCNITNRSIEPARYHGAQPDFCGSALRRYSNQTVETFFEKIGVPFVYDEVGRAYPRSLQASSVVDALRFAAEENGVSLLTGLTVTDLVHGKSGYRVICGEDTLSARFVLLAAGLCAGGEKLGSSGTVLRLMRQKGYPAVSPAPAIVQLKTDPAAVRPLKGIKVNAAVSLLQNGRLLRREQGEVLFCDYGLSGPPVLQLSRAVGQGGEGFEISLNLMPDWDTRRLSERLYQRIKDLHARAPEEFFTGMLNKRVGQTLLKLCGCAGAENTAALTPDAGRLAQMLGDWRFAVRGTTGFLNAQVAAGGLSTGSFDPESMMSRRDFGLFAAGEILDIDGDCGGFNLQWAWSSALCAADSICKINGTERKK